MLSVCHVRKVVGMALRTVQLVPVPVPERIAVLPPVPALPVLLEQPATAPFAASAEHTPAGASRVDLCDEDAVCANAAGGVGTGCMGVGAS